MKKLILILTFFIGTFGVLSCDDTTTTTITTKNITATSTVSTNENETTTTNSTQISSETLQLQAPVNVTFQDRLLNWESVPGATKYYIEIGTDMDIDDVVQSQYEFSSDMYGQFVVRIRAENETTYSEFSEPITIELYKQLSVPQNLQQLGTKITWDSVTDTTGYIVKYNGIEYYTTLTQFNINSLIPVEVKVLAVGSTEDYINNSEYSDPILFTITLKTPQNIHYDDDTIIWDKIDNADGYLLTINDNPPIDTTDTTYQLNYAYSGNIEVQVIAYSNTQGYLNSEVAVETLFSPILNLETPTGLEIDGETLTFNSVNHADAYEIYVNGVLYTTITDNSYTIPSSISDIIDSFIQVKAISTIHNDSYLSMIVYVNTNVITTAQDLANINQYGSYVLGNDIILSSEWIPIAFSGSLDGNGYTISGFIITGAHENTGLFSVLDDATISNLTISGEITLTSDIYAINLGSLAGKVINSTVKNCNINVDINAISNNGIGTLGGVFGKIESVDASNIIYNGNIQAQYFTTGGFAGKANNSENTSSIFQSKVTSNIIVIGGEQSPVGGFIGFLADNQMTISESIAYVNVTGIVYVGGFVGYLGGGSIDNSYVYGTLVATGNSLVHAGGFVGRLEGYNVFLEDCLSMMTISTEALGDHVFVGAFSGSTPGGSYGNIYTDCYYDSELADILSVGNNGVDNGIMGVITSELNEISTFSNAIWNLSGIQPQLVWEISE